MSTMTDTTVQLDTLAESLLRRANQYPSNCTEYELGKATAFRTAAQDVNKEELDLPAVYNLIQPLLTEHLDNMAALPDFQRGYLVGYQRALAAIAKTGLGA